MKEFFNLTTDLKLEIGLLLKTSLPMDKYTENNPLGYKKVADNVYFRSYSKELDESYWLDMKALKHQKDLDVKLIQSRYEGIVYEADLYLYVLDKDNKALIGQKVVTE